MIGTAGAHFGRAIFFNSPYHRRKTSNHRDFQVSAIQTRDTKLLLQKAALMAIPASNSEEGGGAFAK